jgi:hypothetical protein
VIRIEHGGTKLMAHAIAIGLREIASASLGRTLAVLEDGVRRFHSRKEVAASSCFRRPKPSWYRIRYDAPFALVCGYCDVQQQDGCRRFYSADGTIGASG